MRDPHKMLEFDPARYLKTEKARMAFLDDFAEDLPEVRQEAKAIVERSRAMYPADPKEPA